jgi:hypothetical protein
MIGQPGEKVLLGYEFLGFDNWDAEDKKYFTHQLKPKQDEIVKALATFQTSVKNAIKLLKQNSAAAKQSLETEKNSKASNGDFASYLMGKSGYEATGYVPKLRLIGVTTQKVLDDAKFKSAVSTLNGFFSSLFPPVGVKRMEAVQGKKKQEEISITYTIKAAINAAANTVELKATTTAKGEKSATVTIFKLITDSASAYQAIDTPTSSGTARPVFKKKGKEDYAAEPTEYVQDDSGVYTRRYAYMHKKKDVYEILLGPTGYARGRFDTKIARAATPGKLDPDPEWRKVQAFEAHQLPGKKIGDQLEPRQALHVHQELGSGPSARGMCLTSVSLTQNEISSKVWKNKLKKTFANNGTPFEATDASTMVSLIDLAQVPTGQEMLYNLYRPDAQEMAQPVTTDTNAGVFHDNVHMLKSVTKNRELFLRVLAPEFIVNWEEIKDVLAPPTTATPTVPKATGVGVS